MASSTTTSEMRRFIHWLYAASVWACYSSQTDQRLDHDISLMAQFSSPWSELIDAIIEQRGRIVVKASDLDGRIIQHPLYRMSYCRQGNGRRRLVQRKPARRPARFKRMPSTVTTYFPRHCSMRMATTQRTISTRRLSTRRKPRLSHRHVEHHAKQQAAQGISRSREAKYLGALSKQFVPTSPELRQMERYEDFLAERRRLIADAITAHMGAVDD